VYVESLSAWIHPLFSIRSPPHHLCSFPVYFIHPSIQPPIQPTTHCKEVGICGGLLLGETVEIIGLNRLADATNRRQSHFNNALARV
jgi:hypothetical protein